MTTPERRPIAGMTIRRPDLLVCSTLLSRAYGTGCSAANSIEFNGYSIWQVMAERVRAPGVSLSAKAFRRRIRL